MKKEFLYVFQITKLITFEISYYTLGKNKSPYFATSTFEFIRSKRDYKTGGQNQEKLLPKDSLAYNFYKKWDCLHLHDLTEREYKAITKDIELLKNNYNFLYKIPTPYHTNISFYEIVELSKKEPKKINTKEN